MLLLTFCAIALDYLAAPSLYNGSTLWAVGAFVVLTLRGNKKEDYAQGLRQAFGSQLAWRLPLFALLHSALVLAGRAWATELHAASLNYTFSSGGIALLKFLVLVPTAVLLPLAVWRRATRAFRPEMLASLVVLLTFFPHRIFATVWPWYSQWLGHIVYDIARMSVPGLGYSGAPIPTLVGPELDVFLIFGCSGIESVRLFDFLFGLVVAVEWKWLNKSRALLAYFAGLATVLMANVLRISLLVILGNRGFAKWVTQQHIDAGWVFFAMVFLAFLWVTYNWMFQTRTLSLSGTSMREETPSLSL